MKISSDEHLFYNILNGQIKEYPFPHMYIENVFDENIYKRILENLPDNDAFGRISDTAHIASKNNSSNMYRDRYIIDMDIESFSGLPDPQKEFWTYFSKWFLGKKMLTTITQKFNSQIQKRFLDESRKNIQVHATGLITRDNKGFSIGPHTDSDNKVLTLLFYLPKDLSQIHLGTSIYVPIDPSFRGVGGAHYTQEYFKKVTTAPFAPNSLFCFFKTDQSFHGVEIIENENIERNLLIYNMKVT